jgi:hypothetical protein
MVRFRLSVNRQFISHRFHLSYFTWISVEDQVLSAETSSSPRLVNECARCSEGMSFFHKAFCVWENWGRSCRRCSFCRSVSVMLRFVDWQVVVDVWKFVTYFDLSKRAGNYFPVEKVLRPRRVRFYFVFRQNVNFFNYLSFFLFSSLLLFAIKCIPFTVIRPRTSNLESYGKISPRVWNFSEILPDLTALFSI